MGTGYSCSRSFMEREDERSLLATLHKFQQDGNLCDATLISCDGSEFGAHAGVLAAANPLLARKMQSCEFGNYIIEMSLTKDEMVDFIDSVYTGKETIFNARCIMGRGGQDNIDSYQTNLIPMLFEFADKGLYCDTTIYKANGESQPFLSYMFAAKYQFLSQGIRSGSFISVRPPRVISSVTRANKSKESVFQSKSSSINHTKPVNCIGHIIVINPDASKASHRETCLDETSYVCEVCEKKFNHKGHLTIHERSHSGVKPYICKVCDKGFSERWRLKAHQYSHTGKWPHVCDACDKGFSQIGHLKTHLRIHTGMKPPVTKRAAIRKDVNKPSQRMKPTSADKPAAIQTEVTKRSRKRSQSDQKSYACEVCRKTFNHKGHFTIHQRSHSGVKPYTCDVCDKGFTERWLLKAHQYSHTGKWPYMCDVCDKGFAQVSHLKMHLRTHA